MPPIRNSCKAVIQRQDKILMIRCCDNDGAFYLLPGGGQETRELMHETLVRECIEEIGCPVEPGELLYVCEYVGERTHEWERATHQIEFMFRCTLPQGVEPPGPTAPDDVQEGIEWVPVAVLDSLRHYPCGLAQALKGPDDAPVYWGNVK